MANSFKYWDDCVDKLDLEALWMNPQVRTEWIEAGEIKGQKVHLSRDPDGQTFLTQVEMRAVAEIVVRRHFNSRVDLDMICALAELQSDRQLFATRYVRKTNETTLGLMQISSQVANKLYREHGYRLYDVDQDPNLLYRPLVNVYYGVAYTKWLFNFEQKERSEEFVVRAFMGGTKKATHKSTLLYWKSYDDVKKSLPSRSGNSFLGDSATGSNDAESVVSISDGPDTTWDSRTSPEDMQEMWNNRDVNRQWSKYRQKKGNVRFSNDPEKGFYVTRVELKAVAEIVLSKHFTSQVIKPATLCAVAEIISSRVIDGVRSRIGLMGIDYPTARWLYKEMGYKAYKVKSVEYLRKPFVSVYFGAAYMEWLSEYEGRTRSKQFVVQAYFAGPSQANMEETCPTWLRFEEALTYYEETKKQSESCAIM